MQPQSPIHIVNSALPKQSGYAIRTHRIALAQRELGMEPTVVVRPSPVLYKADRVSRTGVGLLDRDGVQYLWESEPRPVRRLLILASQYLRDRDVRGSYRFGAFHSLPEDPWSNFIGSLVDMVRGSIVHAHTPSATADAARTLSERLGIPWVYEVRGFWELSSESELIPKVDGMSLEEFKKRDVEAAKEAAAVLTLGQAMREELIRRGVPDDCIHVVGNAVDSDHFRPQRTKDKELADELEIGDRFVVGYVTNVRRLEGIETVLLALRETSIASSVVFVLCGEGTDLPRLRELANKYGVRRSVRFVGSVPHSDVMRYYSLFDVFVVPRSDIEVCRLVTPLKPLEAMSMQIPTIVSDLPALRELVRPGVTGEVFAPGDSGELARVIDRLRRQSDYARSLGENARRSVMEERSWRTVAERSRQVYETVLTRRGSIANGNA